MMHHGVAAQELKGNLFLTSGRDHKLTLAHTNERGPEMNKVAVDWLTQQIQLAGIRVLILDPLVALHTLPENSNEAAGALLDGLRDISYRTGSAIILVHHTSKVAAGNMDAAGAGASRGASAFVDGARVSRQLVTMTKEEAGRLKIAESDRWDFLRVENGKANLSRRQDAQWLRLVGVRLGNGADLWQEGDTVQTVKRWAPPAPIGATPSELAAVQRALAEAEVPGRENHQSPEWVGHIIAATLSLPLDPPGTEPAQRTSDQKRARAQVRDLIKRWVGDGSLEVFSEKDHSRQERTFIRAGAPADAPGISVL